MTQPGADILAVQQRLESLQDGSVGCLRQQAQQLAVALDECRYTVAMLLCYIQPMTNPLIRVGISSCLLGQNVRFDGGHKLDTLITESLGRYFEWIPICPEMEIGLGTPRESLRLVASAEGSRLVAAKSGADHTEVMTTWAARRFDELAPLQLHGYILKRDSPSCGMERVRVYGGSGTAQRTGSGIYAGLLLCRFGMLPVEEEGRLRDMSIRENFVERIFAHQRWQEFREGKPRTRELVDFHTRHKLTLSSHSDEHYRKLGRLVAAAGKQKRDGVLDEYGRIFMEALRVRATPRKHANVLFHILGFLKKELDSGDKAELVASIDNYRKGFLPLVVPVILLLHHLRRHPVPWILAQTYLNPYPAELMLRNHV
jgi:uncharacterized protein YbgA (DUF1722 family)/uncharacterized protein YbbK (DUF523 family)